MKTLLVTLRVDVCSVSDDILRIIEDARAEDAVTFPTADLSEPDVLALADMTPQAMACWAAGALGVALDTGCLLPAPLATIAGTEVVSATWS